MTNEELIKQLDADCDYVLQHHIPDGYSDDIKEFYEAKKDYFTNPNDKALYRWKDAFQYAHGNLKICCSSGFFSTAVLNELTELLRKDY